MLKRGAMNFNDFIENRNILSDREETELIQARKKVKDFFLKNILNFNLSKREREVYILKNRHNLTHTEIARTLGITRKTSRNILCRANQKINKVIDIFEKEQDT